MSAESKMIEYASCRQVKSPYDNGDKDANTDSRQVVGKLDDRAISLKAVMDIVSDMRDLCRQDVLQDTLKQLQQLPPVKLQPCEDAISRQAIIDMLNDIDAEVNDGCGYMYEHWMDYIKQLPGVTPERPTGQWEVFKDCEGKTRRCKCNVCGYTTGAYTWINPNYCADCGAYMREDDEK